MQFTKLLRGTVVETQCKLYNIDPTFSIQLKLLINLYKLEEKYPIIYRIIFLLELF